MLGLECIGWRRGFALSASKEDGEGSDGEVPAADKPEVERRDGEHSIYRPGVDGK